MHVVESMASCLRKSAHYIFDFFQIGPPSCLDCVLYHLRDAQNTKKKGSRERTFGFRGADMGPVEDQEVPTPCREWCFRQGATMLWPWILAGLFRMLEEWFRKECSCVVSGSAKCRTWRDEDET